MARMYDRTHVDFSLRSLSIPITDLSRRSGLSPDMQWRRGDLVSPLPHHREERFNTNCLIVHSRLKSAPRLEDHIHDILDQLAPHAERVGELVAEIVAEDGEEMRATLTIVNPFPLSVLTLPPGNLALLGGTGVRIVAFYPHKPVPKPSRKWWERLGLMHASRSSFCDIQRPIEPSE